METQPDRVRPMTGAELKAIRKRAGLSLLSFGRRLGFAGSPRNVARKIRRYEASPDPLPPPVVMRARAMLTPSRE